MTKTVNGVTTTYYYVGGRLYGEMTGNSKLIYLYDESGSPYGYIYNDTAYYYEKNAQGDVIGLFHQNGTKIANYTYDAWGNITSIKNQWDIDVTNQPRHQANLNPIRYRGYHYDAELEMYWLTTRFYDPAIGRFINADTQLNDGMLGNNLYAYCGNDPVNCCDCTGNCAHNTMGFDCSACREAEEGFESTIKAIEEMGVHFIPNSQKNGGEIRNSFLVEDYNLILAYSRYLKIEYAEYFAGSVEGIAFEWDYHNQWYYKKVFAAAVIDVFKDVEGNAQHAYVQKTIYHDSHKVFSNMMFRAYKKKHSAQAKLDKEIFDNL